ncbi:hypothetical protein LCGC14_1405050 [marine sediment metagenome]|uniref:Anhydro-N-acetylmuramic acid kinase n=1 Tax=marine sediment metagenome TaxID=412755 RepID=A0A0F9JVX4_9ZZZZ
MSPARRRLVIGLMSGTSRDAVDAAAVSITGAGPDLFDLPNIKIRLIHHLSVRYPRSLASDLLSLDSLTSGDICRINVEVGEAFARAAIKCAEGAGIALKRFQAVASHGQTLWHIPPQGGPKRRRNGSTMQVGEPAVIARRTGLPVVSGFRAADMALGGQGAPLVAYADYILFKSKAPIAVHNLGGISNVTLVTPRLEGVRAFDTGPGNSLMDAAMRRYFGKPFDRGGAKARRGRPDKELLRRLLAHPYFRMKPPKSTGLETFGPAMLDEVLPSSSRKRGEDVLATLAQFTAHSVAHAYRRFVLPGSAITEAVFSGGGTRNTFLMELLGEHIKPVKLSLSDSYGVPAQAKEALAFAVLGAARLDDVRTSLPGVTGASGSVMLGSITHAS